MEEENNGNTELKNNDKGEKGSNQFAGNDENGELKETLLESVPTGESIISDGEKGTLTFNQPRLHSTTRESIDMPENMLAELDENKIFELKEAFLLFDMNADGCIDHNDLRGTLVSLGEKVDEKVVQNMLAEAPNPLDFNAFVNLLGYKTLELDSEQTLVTALSRWDSDKSGYISEERIRHDLMTWGDRFTAKEVDYALDEAPIVQKDNCTMIDYIKFCNQLCGLRKSNKSK